MNLTKLIPWLLGATVIGLAMATAATAQAKSNIYRELLDPEDVPSGTPTVAVVFDPVSVLASVAEVAVAELAKANPQVYFVVLPPEPGESWYTAGGRREGQMVFRAEWTSETSAAEVRSDITEAVKAAVENPVP